MSLGAAEVAVKPTDVSQEKQCKFGRCTSASFYYDLTTLLAQGSY